MQPITSQTIIVLCIAREFSTVHGGKRNMRPKAVMMSNVRALAKVISIDPAQMQRRSDNTSSSDIADIIL